MLPRCSFLPVVSDWIISLSANVTGSIAKTRVAAGMENKSAGLKTGVDVHAGGSVYVPVQLCLCLTFHTSPILLKRYLGSNTLAATAKAN